jgi:hypothetical protein
MFVHYGARGISVCDRWRDSFLDFVSDLRQEIGDPPDGYTLDRINNDGNYEPGNVRWATHRQQCSNRRCTSMITFQGITRPLCEWANVLQIDRRTLYARLFTYRWPLSDVFLRPVQAKTVLSKTRQRVWLTYQGRTQDQTAWARELGIPTTTLQRWMHKFGLSLEQAAARYAELYPKRRVNG